MKVYEGKDIRNLVVIGHSHSGKTSLVSAMLYTGGATPKLGRVDDGSTVTDHDDEEISRQMTISTSIASAGVAQHQDQSARFARIHHVCP